MRAIIAERPGALAEVLALRDISEPRELAPGEVVVRMLASTINPSDAVTVSGAYGSRTEFPFVPGFEGVGVIERVGPAVPPGVLGQRVLPIGSAGNWQQLKRIQYSWCVPVPDDIPGEIACFAYINPLTAVLMVDRFVASGMSRVAITAATSTIAAHLAELLNERGIRSIALTRGTPARTVADPARWSAVIDTSAPAWHDQLAAAVNDPPPRDRLAAPAGHQARREVSHSAPGPRSLTQAESASTGLIGRHRSGTTGRDLDLIFDCVGGELGATLMERLVPGGALVHYGLLSGEPLPPSCFEGRRGTRVEMFRLRDVIHSTDRRDLPALFAPVFAHLRAGRLRTPVAQELPLSDLPALLQTSPTSSGKLLLRPNP